MSSPADPVRPADSDARALARSLMSSARFASLSFLHPDNGLPFASRIGFGLGPAGEPTALLSAIALHTRALRQNPAAALLIGEPGEKGDPLVAPRLALQVTARFEPRGDAAHDARRTAWLAGHPKAGLYLDLPDFAFVTFLPGTGLLNGGFGRAFHIAAADLLAGG